MNPDEWLLAGVASIAVLIGAIAVLSASDAAMNGVRRARIAQLAEEGNARALLVERLFEQPERLRLSLRLLIGIFAGVALGLAVALGILSALPWIAGLPGPTAALRALPFAVAAAVLSLPLVSLLGQALPRSLASARPERLALAWAPWWSALKSGMAPLVWLNQSLTAGFARALGTQAPSQPRLASSEEEIKSIVEGSAEQGLLQEEEREMIHSIFDFAETVVRKVMVPRIDVTCLEAATPIDEALRVVLEDGHSRIPIYEETVDRIIGVVHVKDLLRPLLAGKKDAPLREVMRPAYFVPEGKKVGELLREFKLGKNQLAIVIDEYGGTSGLVTVEDLLEEIVGDLQDEYDVEEPDFVVVDEKTSILDARLVLDDVNDRLDLDLPTEDYDTIGGFVFGLLGRLPAEGDVVPWGSLDFTVEQTDGHRVQKVRVTRMERNDSAEDSASVVEAR